MGSFDYLDDDRVLARCPEGVGHRSYVCGACGKRAYAGRMSSPFAVGAATWGIRLTGDALDRFYASCREGGVRHFDTAHVYASWIPGGDGVSERALGDLVRRNNDRANVAIATKGGHPALSGMYDRPDDYLSPTQIAADARDSLERPGVAFVDLYYLHRDDPRVPVGEIVDALHDLVAAGRVKTIGVSNWTAARVASAQAYAAANQRTPLVATQPKLSLGVPKPSGDPTVPPFDMTDIASQAAAGLTVYAYSSTANGYFASGGMKGGGWRTPESERRLAAAENIAGQIGATTNQVALAWLLRLPFKVVPILGTENAAHLADALAAANVKLTPAQVVALSNA